MGAKSKTPWITINGKNVADSQFSIEYLKKELNIDGNSHLSAREKGFAMNLRLALEDHLMWLMGTEAYFHLEGKHLFTHYPPGLFPFPDFVAKILLKTVIKSKIRNMMYLNGIGRHKREEQHKMGLAVFQAINDILGDNKFLMGIVIV